ncbi:hypothetical protein HNQ77_000047 [Silvibacterium bohemicum]|uniref:DinB-like domain-containing protein n=1 Tax=Silvibacterium bohemicum TaxID=1577686 RepID=A0A841JQQ6_9BACT|nr:DinB family protein [Silvibacterium bohemicum]MBB6142109.1 hypothetical protein [Silvibacterium bohemicum]
MNELQRTLIANGVGAPPAHVLEAVDGHLAHRRIPGAPHSIYEEVWHLAFWMELSLDWIAGKPTPYPEHASEGFPASTTPASTSEEWPRLKNRFLRGLQTAAAIAGSPEQLAQPVQCLSQGTEVSRVMPVRDQIEGIAAHNAYHLGRIILLQQLIGVWPPPSGGDTW